MVATDRSCEHVAASLDGLLATLAREPLTDLVAGARRLDELEPVALRVRILIRAGEDLDGVAVLELGVEGNEAPVDARADGLVANLRVDRIGKVDRGCALRQLDQLAARSEGKDPVLLHRHPGMLE